MTTTHNSFALAASTASVQEVLFIDSRVPDLQTIVAAVRPGVKVVILQPDESGVVQMARVLQGEHGLTSVSVVSHGDEGVLLLGNGPLFGGNLQQYQAELKAIGAALTADGDLLLYGCDVGAGDVGASFVQALAEMTDADVAASNNGTGAAARGGDWNLEVSTGTIETAPLMQAENLTGYSYALHTAAVSTVAELKAAIAAGAGDSAADTITLTGNITFASAADAIVIQVTDGQMMSIVGGGFSLDGANFARVLEIQSGSNVALSNITIKNGLVAGNGGAAGAYPGFGGVGGAALGAGIWNAGTLNVSGSTITGNHAAGGGGGGGGGPGGNGSAVVDGNFRGGIGGVGGDGVGGSGVVGGRGGDAVGGIYNTGALTITGTGITGNVGAGGSGGGGSSNPAISGAGGVGGSGVGGIWNVDGTTILDASTSASIASGNVGDGEQAGAVRRYPTLSLVLE